MNEVFSTFFNVRSDEIQKYYELIMKIQANYEMWNVSFNSKYRNVMFLHMILCIEHVKIMQLLT